MIKEKDEKLIISSHFGKGNEHYNYIESSPCLVIFTEPHAYISPKLYTSKNNVPTWDYITVQVYGTGKIIDSIELKESILKEMIVFYEEEYSEQWDSLSDSYKKRMMNGIVAFEIEIEQILGKKKLSQNKSNIEQINIMEHLSKSEDTAAQKLSEYMKIDLQKE